MLTHKFNFTTDDGTTINNKDKEKNPTQFCNF